MYATLSLHAKGSFLFFKPMIPRSGWSNLTIVPRPVVYNTFFFKKKIELLYQFRSKKFYPLN